MHKLRMSVLSVALALGLMIPATVHAPEPEPIPIELTMRWQEALRWAEYYGIAPELAERIVFWADSTDVSRAVAFRLIWVESRFRVDAVSEAGAIGIAQVMPTTARILDSTVTVVGLYDVDTNLRLGLTYLQDMLTRYDGDVWLALTAYYRGPEATDRLVAKAHPRIAGVFQQEYAYQVLSGVY